MTNCWFCTRRSRRESPVMESALQNGDEAGVSAKKQSFAVMEPDRAEPQEAMAHARRR